MPGRLIATIVVTSMLMLPLHQAFAHGGGLNSEGCHNERATGGYHCHRGRDDDIPWATIAGVAGGVLLLWLVIEAVQDKNDPSIVQFVPHYDERYGHSLAAEIALGGQRHIGFRSTTGMTERHRERAYVGGYWKLRF